MSSAYLPAIRHRSGRLMAGERQTEPHHAERTTDGMGHVWTEESDLDRLDELEAEVVRLRAERNIALDRAKGWRDRATAAEARVAELEEQIEWTVQRCNAAIGDGFQGNENSAVAAVCDRLEGVQDRIDRAVAERTAAIVDAIYRRANDYEHDYAVDQVIRSVAKTIEREFPAPGHEPRRSSDGD